MKVPQALKPSIHKIEITKAILGVLAVVLVVFAVVSLIQENQRSNQAVASHTQTLNEIKQAVTNIEANQKINSGSVISYINCLINSQVTSPSQFQATEQACRAGIPEVK